MFYLLQHTFDAWRIVFWINIAAQLSSFVVFILFGSAKIQNWNYPGGVPPAPEIGTEMAGRSSAKPIRAS